MIGIFFLTTLEKYIISWFDFCERFVNLGFANAHLAFFSTNQNTVIPIRFGPKQLREITKKAQMKTNA